MKYIKCDNCRKLYTQTIYKKMKSLLICPYCGTKNQEHARPDRKRKEAIPTSASR